jgi:hypothetical protein
MENSDKSRVCKVELEIIDIDGIPYYTDKEKRIYRHETIHGVNPEVVARWEWIDNKRMLVKVSEK